METDITPLLSVVIQLCAALLLAVGSVAVPWVAHRLARLIGAPHEDVIRDDLDDALHLAIAYGMWQAQARAVDLGCVEIPEAVVRHAVEYAARAVPDAIRRFGVQERLGEMITARLPGLPAEAPPVERRAG